MSTTPVAADVATRDRVWFVGGAVFVLFADRRRRSIGPAGPDWWRVPLALVDHLPLIAFDTGVSDSEWAIVWKVRMPRVVLGGLVGGMLSIAGAGYQGVFRNPLVDPYLLGAAAGAGLGATIVLTVGRSATVGWPIDPVPAVAFGFAVGDGDGDVLGRCVVRWFAQRRDAGPRRGRGRLVRDGGADVRAAAQPRRRPRGVPLDPRKSVAGDRGAMSGSSRPTWS